MRRLFFIGSLAIASVATACSHTPPVVLSNEWPARAGDYEDVTLKWTRHGRDRIDGFEQTIDVYAVFKAPEWQVAFIEKQAERHRLPASEKQALLEKAKADLDQYYEVQILVATHDKRANDLDRGKRSTWRVALMDESGAEILPSEIKRDRRRRPAIQADYPSLSDFHDSYTAKFPRSVDLLRPEARRFSLKVTGAHVGVVLEWAEAK